MYKYNKISKYNHQPMKKIDIDKNKKNIFFNVGNSIKRESKCKYIYIKSHPVKNIGHFNDIKENEIIHFVDCNINPIILLEDMDEVYVCTSQMGFEALMCGKKVHVFGVPFYGGWEATIDYQKCNRRNNKRSIEEIFIAYIFCVQNI